MAPEEVYERNRGCWHLGARADKEQFAVFSYKGEGVLAMEIRGLVEDPKRPGRRILEGEILGRVIRCTTGGWVRRPRRTETPCGTSTPSSTRRSAGADVARLSCTTISPGHDQRAIHDRIAKLGSVKDFLDWFDRTWDEPDEGDTDR